MLNFVVNQQILYPLTFSQKIGGEEKMSKSIFYDYEKIMGPLSSV